jgi:cobalt-zinc-cadmium efflux system outer membrane protein
MRLFSALCALAACSHLAGAQRAPTDSIHLTRAQAIANALANNAQLDVAREQTAQARARRVTGNAIPDPQLGAAFDQLAGPLTLGGAPSKPVEVDLDIPFPNKFRLNNRIGNADVQNFEYNYRLQQQFVALATSAAYDSLLVAQRHHAEQAEALQLSTDFLKRTQARFDAGSAPRLDVIKAQVDVAQSQNDLVAAERAVALAQASLNRDLGRIIGAPIAPTDSLGVPPALPDSTTIEQVALASRSELKQLQAQRAGAAATTSLTREYWLPDFTFSVQRDYAAPGSPLFTTGIALPLPVFFWQHNRGDIAQAVHVERELSATYRDALAQVTQDVRQAYATASTAMRQVLFLRDQLVPSAREAYRVASTSYTLGGSSALDVLSARRDLLDAESQLTEALGAANTAYADLQRALGVPLPQIGVQRP